MNILSKKFLLLIIVIEVFFSSIFGMYIYNEESIQIEKKFKKDVEDKLSILNMQLQLNYEALYSVKGLFDASTTVTYPEFKNLTDLILKRHKDIKALEWVPKINHENRDFYETMIKRYFPTFQITQKDDSTEKMVKRDIASYYYPVLYLNPYLNNEQALGFDLTSNHTRFNTLQKAIKTNSLQSTPLITLVQDDKNTKGFITVVPIYKKNTSKNNKPKTIYGFVVSVFDIKELINNALHKTHTDGINFLIYDITEKKDQLIYNSNLTNVVTKNRFKYFETINTLDKRVWRVEANPTLDYINERRTILPTMIILISIGFILGTTLYINMIIQRNRQIEDKVNQRTKELNEANEKLKVISRTDPLTKIANRRYFNETIQSEWHRAIREKTNISLMVIDVDYFKLYNDKYGHIQGDKCLKEVAMCLRNSLNRSSDFLARFGGEEFVIILPNTNDVLKVAKACKDNIEKLQIINEASKISKYVTISVGFTTMQPEITSSLTNFINQADKALYKAKQNGRNTIAVI